MFVAIIMGIVMVAFPTPGNHTTTATFTVTKDGKANVKPVLLTLERIRQKTQSEER